MKKSSFRRTLLCAALIFAPGAHIRGQNSEKPIAIIAGQPVYEQDLLSVAGSSLLELQKQEYKAQSDALDHLIRKKLLEAEAKKQGVTVEDLLKQEVDSEIADPSDELARGYYLAAKSPSSLPFESVEPQIKRLLKNAETLQAREKYEDSLVARAEVTILLRPPTVEISYDPARVRGNPQAPITMVEFSDFQCPYCKKVDDTLRDLLKKYNGQLKLAYRDFPMRTLHPNAEIAAEAGRCAVQQGKFWEYHDALFADQSKLDEAGLEATAQGLGMDKKSFHDCLASGKFKSEVEKDVQDGTQAGVTGTPGFFINGEFVSGAQPEADFVRIIDRESVAARTLTSTQPAPALR